MKQFCGYPAAIDRIMRIVAASETYPSTLFEISDEFNSIDPLSLAPTLTSAECRVFGEKIYGAYVDELTLHTGEGLAFYPTSNVRSMHRVYFPNDTIFEIDGVDRFHRRPNAFTGGFPYEYCRMVGREFLPLFVVRMSQIGLTTSICSRMDDSILSSDFTETGLARIRKHYYSLTVAVLNACKYLEQAKWKLEILERIEDATPNFVGN